MKAEKMTFAKLADIMGLPDYSLKDLDANERRNIIALLKRKNKRLRDLFNRMELDMIEWTTQELDYISEKTGLPR